MQESLVAKHLIIDQETAGKCWIKACSYPALGCHDHCVFNMVWGNHPPGGQGLGVGWRNFVQANVATKAQFILARFCTQNLDHGGQDPVEIIVVGDISVVCC